MNVAAHRRSTHNHDHDQIHDYPQSPIHTFPHIPIHTHINAHTRTYAHTGVFQTLLQCEQSRREVLYYGVRYAEIKLSGVSCNSVCSFVHPGLANTRHFSVNELHTSAWEEVVWAVSDLTDTQQGCHARWLTPYLLLQGCV